MNKSLVRITFSWICSVKIITSQPIGFAESNRVLFANQQGFR